MEKRETKDRELKSVNLVLLSISMVIFGALGLIFITQMEIQRGWVWDDIRDEYPVDTYAIVFDDINDDKIDEIVVYNDVVWEGRDEIENNTPEYGSVYMLDGKTGKSLWNEDFDGPIKEVQIIKDQDGDGIRDLFVCKATNEEEWDEPEEGQEQGSIEVIGDQFSNFFLSGAGENGEGKMLSIPESGTDSFSNFYTKTLLDIPDDLEREEDMICLQYDYDESNIDEPYELYIKGYYYNGSLYKNSTKIGNYYPQIQAQSSVPYIEFYDYNDQIHLLFIDGSYINLINMSALNYSTYIYSYGGQFESSIQKYMVIEDLNGDNNKEIMLFYHNGTINILNGGDGSVLVKKDLEFDEEDTYIDSLVEVPNTVDGTYVIIEYGKNEQKISVLFQVDKNEISEKWREERQDHGQVSVFPIDEDIDNDGINDLIFHLIHQPLGSTNQVSRYKFITTLDKEEHGVINTDFSPNDIQIFSDIDDDGKKDLLICADSRIFIMSITPPSPIWLSSEFPFGLPLFFICSGCLAFGIIILILKAKQLNFSIRKGMKEKRLTFVVNLVSIILMSISFLLFLSLVNVFNSTLFLGYSMSQLVISFIIIAILWYSLLPLTSAVYNQFAPQFASFFIKIRTAFFRISKSYKNDIVILDMEGRDDLGTVNRLKRIVLPLLLSISVGFYSYNYFSELLGYPQGFKVFSSGEFFQFIVGYNLFCTLPMLLSFLIFSVLISGNYLLDDAGVVYYLESKKNRKPGDIEPISVWSQSFIKGVAGLSALITFGMFFLTVDFSGFFAPQDDPMSTFTFSLMGAFMVIVMFWGTPFLTSFSYMLLTIDIMDDHVEKNVEKLYKKMEKQGYDTTPRTLTQLYPSGYSPSQKIQQIEEKHDEKAEKKEQKKGKIKDKPNKKKEKQE